MNDDYTNWSGDQHGSADVMASGIVKSKGKYVALYTLRNGRPGYDIAETTDYFKVFKDKHEAQEWLRMRITK